MRAAAHSHSLPCDPVSHPVLKPKLLRTEDITANVHREIVVQGDQPVQPKAHIDDANPEVRVRGIEHAEVGPARLAEEDQQAGLIELIIGAAVALSHEDWNLYWPVGCHTAGLTSRQRPNTRH